VREGGAARRLLAHRRAAFDLRGGGLRGEGRPLIGRLPHAAPLAAVGALTLAAQVVVLRELAVAFYGSELVYLLGLAFLLAGTAAGTLAGRALPARRPDPPAGLFLVFAALLPATVALARALHRLLGGTPGAFLAFPAQLAGMALVLLPIGALGGLLFQRAAAVAVAAGGTLASAYAIESAGALAGGAATTLLVAGGVSNLATGLWASLSASAAAGLPSPPRGGRRHRLGALAGATLALAALAASARLDRATTAWNHPGLVATVDTPYGRATLTRAQGQLAVFQNGALAWESEGTAEEELVHVAALAVAAPRRMLLLGGSVAGLPDAALAHAPERIDLVELDGRLLEAVLPHLPAASRAALASHAVHLEIAEPRALLARPARYDLVIVGQPEPDSGQANRFYTLEFFAACANRLAPGGVLALRLSGAENLWTPALARRTASVERALAAVFPAVAVLPGSTTLLLASPSRLELDPEVLTARLAARGIASRLVTAPWLRYRLTDDRRAEVAARLAATPAAENRDARPVCYPLTLQIWLARFFPALGRLELPGWVEAPAFVAALARRALLVAAAGAFGMILEGVLVLAFQVRRGVLFQDLGLLLTMFMAGLAAGSGWADRRLGAGASRRAGAAILLGAAAVAFLSAALLTAGVDLGLAGVAALLAAAGAATGALFGWASLAGVTAPGEVVAPLYAADLAGGAVGALAGTLFLLPVLGLPATALLLGVGALALLGLVGGGKRRLA